MPKPVADNMKAMKNLFGGLGGGGKSGGDAQASIATVKKLLAKERNIKIWESRGRIFLDGRVTSKHMRTRISKLLKVYSNIVDLTEYQPDMDTFVADMELIKDKIEETLNKSFDANRAFVDKQEVDVNIINDKIVIGGELNTKDDIGKAIHIAKIYNNNVVNNLIVRKQMIEVAAIFAKNKRTNTDKIGSQGLQSAIITLPVITAAATNATPVRYPFDYFRSYRHTASPAIYAMGNEKANISFFNFFKKNAILARPHLAAVNGQSSKFLGGGEKAIKTVTANSSSVNYKEYGVILETTPSLTTDGRINLKLKLEFSVPEASGDDFITFRHEGQAILSKGQGMVLSGLINEARSRGFTRTPFLGKVPILNFFFSQRDETKEAEDLVLITIPRVPSKVTKAPYPKTEKTAKSATDSFWINKPDVPHRILDHLKGKRGRYWMKDAEVLFNEDGDTPESKPKTRKTKQADKKDKKKKKPAGKAASKKTTSKPKPKADLTSGATPWPKGEKQPAATAARKEPPAARNGITDVPGISESDIN